ncbi:8-oxoguanine DNA glycosylase [Vibrio algarum]|uniref:DNA lyase n=1 Tax=Vibrio algarum TaxID=3020714 RepID=A0ABT4YUJ9_9VIBR|nr:hypothetical protein [Vibrio sp. KJ40-1]MDB1124693.1 hypothetical protein [Vibrio sp. KJ40-1]
MKLYQIDMVVSKLCADINDLVEMKHWSTMSTNDIICELFVCILGSGVRYEVAVSYASAINSCDSVHCSRLDYEQIYVEVNAILSSSITNKITGKTYSKYRYPQRGASNITKSLLCIRNDFGSINTLLNRNLNVNVIRRKLIDSCSGLGPKQSSHFLRNIGYTENIAVIDRHIIKYIETSQGKSLPKQKLNCVDTYENIESNFHQLIKKFEYSASIVDQAIWFVIRNLGKEVKA